MIEILKKSYLIRKIETKLLELYKEGHISGTVHTCVGQEYTGAIIGKYFKKGDLVVSNHRGHGHYISVTNDIYGLISELLGKKDGASKGIGGSQHLINDGFISNGIQGGMLPIASGYALSNKIKKNQNVSIAFLGDGTLGEGILYETLNMCSNWSVPIVFLLENNGIAQSTDMKQSFSGDIENRIKGFGLDYYEGSIYEIENLDKKIHEAVDNSRSFSKPSFVNIELGRINSHSKGDDNRDDKLIESIVKKDPLNIFFNKQQKIKKEWDKEFDDLLSDLVKKSLSSESLDISNSLVFNKENSNFSVGKYIEENSFNNSQRFNELIYSFFKKQFDLEPNSIMIGEDIETSNRFNPKEYGGAFKVTKDLSKIYEDKIRNTPISEQAIVGFGIGLALNGHKAYVEIMFGDFATLAFDQIYQHASKINLMFGKIVSLPIVIRTPMGGYRGYGPTHSQSIEKHFLGIPGLKVIALNQLINPIDLYNNISKENGPVLVIENKMLYTRKLYHNIFNGYKLLTSSDTYPIARLKPIIDEPSFTIVSYGGVIDEILMAIKELFINHECFCELFAVCEISRINIPELKKSLQITKKLLVVEEGNSFASFGSELVSSLLENNYNNFDLFRISNNNIIPSSRELELKVLPTKDKIVSLINNNTIC